MEARGLTGVVLATGAQAGKIGEIVGNGCPYTLPVAGEPLARHGAQALADAGARRVDVIAPAEVRERLVTRYGVSLASELCLAHLEPADSSPAAAIASHPVNGHALLLHLGDSLAPDLRGAISGFANGHPAMRLLMQSGDPTRPATQLPHSDERVIGALLSAEAVGLVKLNSGRLAGLELAGIAAVLSELGATVDAHPLERAWKYRGTVEDVLEANRLALDALPAGAARGRPHARIEGRVQIHPSVTLRDSTVRGPAVIGPGARLVETFVGPYTSIDHDVELEGVEIENSLVLARARIRYPGRRLEASIVGEGATVERDFALPSALRVRVGRAAEISLS